MGCSLDPPGARNLTATFDEWWRYTMFWNDLRKATAHHQRLFHHSQTHRNSNSSEKCLTSKKYYEILYNIIWYNLTQASTNTSGTNYWQVLTQYFGTSIAAFSGNKYVEWFCMAGDSWICFPSSSCCGNYVWSCSQQLIAAEILASRLCVKQPLGLQER